MHWMAQGVAFLYINLKYFYSDHLQAYFLGIFLKESCVHLLFNFTVDDVKELHFGGFLTKKKPASDAEQEVSELMA